MRERERERERERVKARMTLKKITFCEKECEKRTKIVVIKCVIARTERR